MSMIPSLKRSNVGVVRLHIAAVVALAVALAPVLAASPAHADEAAPPPVVTSSAEDLDSSDEAQVDPGAELAVDETEAPAEPAPVEAPPADLGMQPQDGGADADAPVSVLLLPSSSEETVGDFRFRSDQGDPATATLVEYLGSESEVIIPGRVTIGGVIQPVTVIGVGAFDRSASSDKLTAVTLPDTVVHIEDQAFMGNVLAAVTIPDSVVSIGDDAFFDNPLTHVVVGKGVTSLGSLAFEHYDWDTDAVLPLEVIFTGPPPSSFVAGSPTTFSGSLADVEAVTISFPIEYGSDVYAGGFTKPTWQGYGTAEVVTVHFDLGIAGGAMSLQYAESGEPFAAPLPPATDGFRFAGWYTDDDLSAPFDDSAPVTSDLVLYADWDLLDFWLDTTVDDVFYLVNTHADNPTAAAGYYFGSAGSSATILPEVEIGGTTYTVTTISSYAFQGAGLAHVTIPNTITVIEEYAFAMGGVHNDILIDVNPLGDLVVPDSVVSIGDYAFAGADLTSLVLGSGVREIGEAAFIQTGLTSVTLPAGLMTLGQFAFDQNSLTEVVIPDSVTTIAFMAFAENPLRRVTIGSGVTSIGELAFQPGRGFSRSAAPSTVDVYFTGPPPSSVSAAGHYGSFGPAARVLVHYLVAYDASTFPGGFTRPQWQGYATAALASVAFDLHGHGSTISPATVVVGDLLDPVPAPSAPGWTFTGWYLDSPATQPFTATQPIVGNLTLFAGWKPVAVAAPAVDSELAMTGNAPPAGLLGVAFLLLIVGVGARLLTGRPRRVVGSP